MDVDLKQLLSDPKDSELFRRQSGLDDAILEEILADYDPSMFWQWLQPAETL
jgi:hypothetical protein